MEVDVRVYMRRADNQRLIDSEAINITEEEIVEMALQKNRDKYLHSDEYTFEGYVERVISQ